MKEKKLLSLIDKTGIIVPDYLLAFKEELNIDYEELLLISLLLSYDKDIPFDVNRFKQSIHTTDMNIMKSISSLIEKKLLVMKVVKDDTGKMKEYIDIDILKKKIVGLIIGKEEIKEEPAKENIYAIIEQEFGRTLSPIECETIKSWLDNKIEEQMIKDALKEAVLNGVTNLKYIDKILYEWKRNGKKKKEVRKEEKSIDFPEDNWWDIDE